MRRNIAHMQLQPSKLDIAAAVRSPLAGNYWSDSWMKRWHITDTADTQGEPCVTGATRVHAHMTTANGLFRQKTPQCHSSMLPSPSYSPQEKRAHMCRWCSPFAGLAYEYIWNITYLFPALRGTHCIPPPPTRTFLSPNSSKLLGSCLFHTFLCPVSPDRTLKRRGVKMRDLWR